MQENADQNNSEYGHFSLSAVFRVRSLILVQNVMQFIVFEERW